MMIREQTLAICVAAIILCAGAQADAEGGQEGNGGNDVGLEFQVSADRALVDLELSSLSVPGLTAETMAKLEQVHEKAKIVAAAGALSVSIDGVSQPCDAKNDPNTMTIEVSDLWHTITDVRVQRALAIHELEGLAGDEGTGVYRLSAAYLAYEGYDGDPADALGNVGGGPRHLLGAGQSLTLAVEDAAAFDSFASAPTPPDSTFPPTVTLENGTLVSEGPYDGPVNATECSVSFKNFASGAAFQVGEQFSLRISPVPDYPGVVVLDSPDLASHKPGLYILCTGIGDLLELDSIQQVFGHFASFSLNP